MSKVKIRDTVTGGSVLASGAQPPASVKKKILVVFGQNFIGADRQKTPWVTYRGSTLPKNHLIMRPLSGSMGEI